MEHLYPLIRSIFIFFFLIVFVQILKRKGIFLPTDLPVFGRLITELILPVTIFATLSVGRIDFQLLYAPGIYLAASLLTCGLAYVICRLLHLSDAITGAIVVLAGFGSTSTVAYPLILQTYGAQSEAMTSALIIGEFGSCIPFFSIGILILAYFGGKTQKQNVDIVSVLKAFIKTPIFISLVAGFTVSLIPPLSELMSNMYFSTIFSYFTSGFEMIVAITIGLMIRPVAIRNVIRYIVILVPLSVIIMPLIVYALATMLNVPLITREILFIEAAVPSGAVAAVMADKYGCDGTIASVLVIVSFLASLITLPVLIILFL